MENGGSGDVLAKMRLGDVNQASRLVEEVLLIADDLASLEDLRPCSRVNDLFGQLVSLCIKPWNETVVEEVMGDKKIKGVIGKLREVCAEGEGELEKYWAERFLRELEDMEKTSTDKVSLTTGPQTPPPFKIHF